MGRPSHVPQPGQRRQVEAMAGYGVPEADIGRVVGIDAKTLRKHYREELDTGHVKANAKVAENLFRKATGEGREAVIAAIFWLKVRAGWKETSVAEITGRDGGPLTFEHLSDDELKATMMETVRGLGLPASAVEAFEIRLANPPASSPRLPPIRR